jgi:hypothetical protein
MTKRINVPLPDETLALIDDIASRGEVCQVDFDPTRGSEIRKSRLALILQNARS